MGCNESKTRSGHHKNINNIARSHTKHPKGEVFYLKEQTEGVKQNIEGGTARILLFLSFKTKSELGENLLRSKFLSNSKINISVALSSIQNNNYFSELGRTDDLDLQDGNYSFHTSFAMNYHFERNQHLKIKIFQDNKEVQTIQIVLGKIMGSKNQMHNEIMNHDFSGTKSHYDENEPLLLNMHAVAEKESNKNKLINFHVNSTFQSHDDYFYIISNNIRKDQKSQRVYKSSEVSGNHIENTIKNLNINDICLGENQMPITFDFYSVSHGHIANLSTTLQSLSTSNTVEIISLNSNQTIGTCRISYDIYEKLRFVELLERGLQISLSVGIDYTASNRNPTDRNSLHYIQGTEPNFYEQAIRTCGGIVAYYDYDQRFPLFGFGAILNNSTQVSHCFNVNFNANDPFVDGIDGIIQSYKNSLFNLRLDGPTYFSPLIKNMVEVVKNEMMNSNSSVYYILLILTDGAIHDMDATREVICEAATLPISIIIIGIGNSDFSNMIALDGDNEPLVNRKGERIQRDIVQFVMYEKFKLNPQELAAEVLYEVPGQVEQYYSMNNFNDTNKF